MEFKKIDIEKTLKKHDEYTKELLKGISDNEKPFCKSLRLLGRAMLEANLLHLKAWIDTCESIGKKGRKNG